MGGVIGGVAAIALLIFIIVWRRQRLSAAGGQDDKDVEVPQVNVSISQAKPKNPTVPTATSLKQLTDIKILGKLGGGQFGDGK